MPLLVYMCAASIKEAFVSGLAQRVQYEHDYQQPLQQDALPTPSLPSHRQKRYQPFQRLLRIFAISAMVFGAVQAGRSLVSNTLSVITLQQRVPIVQQYHRQMNEEHKILESRIDRYSSPEGIEELARNNLDMVGENEILVQLQ